MGLLNFVVYFFNGEGLVLWDLQGHQESGVLLCVIINIHHFRLMFVFSLRRQRGLVVRAGDLNMTRVQILASDY